MSSVKPLQAAAPHDVQPAPAGRQVATPLHDAVEVARAARRRRARRILNAMALWVGGPTLLGLVYFLAIAESQYESFATIMVPGPRVAMLTEYLRSRDVLARLDEEVNFSEHYTRSTDPIGVLPPDAGSEQRYSSFLRAVELRPADSGVIRLRVRAYDAKRAQQFSARIIAEGRAFLAAHSEDGRDHLLAIAKPSLASESTYPRRAYGVLTVFLISLALYAIGSLLIAAAREHAQL